MRPLRPVKGLARPAGVGEAVDEDTGPFTGLIGFIRSVSGIGRRPKAVRPKPCHAASVPEGPAEHPRRGKMQPYICKVHAISHPPSSNRGVHFLI